MRTTAALIALGAVVQQATATHGGYDWLKAVPYSCPSNTENQCSPHQQSGYSWQALNPGPFHQYDNMQYKGFQCKDSFGKRDLVTRTSGFQDKCIAASACKTPEQNPVISCQDKGFSVDQMHVTTEEPQDLEFTYGYENGATCKHVASCSSGGTIVKNSQCGGAKSVTVGLPPSAPKESCSFAIHSVGFNCGSASAPVPSATIVPVVSSHTYPVYSFTVPGNQTTPTMPASAPTAPVSVPTGTAPYQTYPIHTPSVPSGTAPHQTYPINTPSVPIGTAPIGSPSVPVSSSTPNSPTGASSVPVVSSPVSSPSAPTTYPVNTPQSSIPNSPTGASSVPVVSSPVSSPSAPASYPVNTPQSSTPNSPTGASSVPVVSSPVSSPSAPVTYPVSTPQSSTPNSPTGASSVPVVSSPVPGTTVPVYTTEVVVTTETTCPVTNTITSGSTTSTQVTTTVSTITSTSVSTVCTQCVPPPVATPVQSGTPSSPATPVISVPVSSGSANSPTPATSAPAAPGTTEYTTEIETTYVTTCPVTNTITTGGSTSYQTTTTVSTATSTYTSTVVRQGTTVAPAPVPASSNGNSPVPVSSSPAQPSAPCPTVLPQCMNTWIKLTTCENNAASDCYCTDSSFTSSVQSCVSAWAASDKEVQAALSYLAGICAPHVSANPGIITNVPKTITLVPTPASSLVGASGATPAPTTTSTSYTILSISKTVTIPVTYTSGISSGQAIPSSSTTSVLVTGATLPLVHFTTANSPVGSSSQLSVGLAAGSPAPAPAYPTGSANGAVGAVGGPTGATTLASISGKPVNTATASPITPFQGAAAKVGSGVSGVIIAGLMGLVALV